MFVQGPSQSCVYKSQLGSVHRISEEARKKAALAGNILQTPINGSMDRLVPKAPDSYNLCQCTFSIGFLGIAYFEDRP